MTYSQAIDASNYNLAGKRKSIVSYDNVEDVGDELINYERLDSSTTIVIVTIDQRKSIGFACHISISQLIASVSSGRL